DNIYALNLQTQQINQLTSSKYGAYNPSIDTVNKKLLFNNYQLNGYDIASIPFPNEANTLSGKQKDTFINYARPLIAQESNGNVFDSVSTLKFPAKPYKEFSHLFYFHSLSPILEENDFNDDLNMGLQIRSNNKLNTLDFYAGYQYNNGLNRSEYLAGFTYKRFLPVFDVKYINRARLATARLITGNEITLIPVNWRENLTKFEISIPLTFNQLNMNYNLDFTASTSYTSRYEIQNRPLNFISTLKFPLLYEVYFSRNNSQSARDLAPRWGQSFALSYQNLAFENQLKGDILLIRTSFFLPGLLKNHSTQARFNYQNNSGIYAFNIDIPRISGYANLSQPKELNNTLLLNYRFPLLYPDLEIGPLAYIKRIRGGFFADFENVGKENPFTPRTYGLSLYADMNLLRFYLPNFEIGGKLIFINEKPVQNPIFEFGFNYNY
ncbi:MAG: hypothetical protein WBP45_07675, partial [Daejeonella sp.]